MSSRTRRSVVRLRLNPKRRTNMPSPPSMSKGGSGCKQEQEAKRLLVNRNEKNASGNKKSTEPRSNGSEKSENMNRNTNVSVACEPEKNVSKSACDVCSGMQRSSVSENDACTQARTNGSPSFCCCGHIIGLVHDIR